VTVAFELPADRPAGLRRPRAVDVNLTRVDTNDPATWSWGGFAQPFHRFDPRSGSFRVRYAGWTSRAALRERFPDRRIPEGDADLRLVTLHGRVRMLDLTSESVLDALDVDDRISTGRLPRIRTRERPDPFLDTCGRLADLVAGWWDDVHAIRYRSRTTPSQTNVAFCQHADLETEAVPLAAATDLLVTAVIGDGFSVPVSWLG